MKHLLIAGGTGFIGYHLANRFKKKGWKVTSLSLKKPKKKKIFKRCKLYFVRSDKKKLYKKKIK